MIITPTAEEFTLDNINRGNVIFSQIDGSEELVEIKKLLIKFAKLHVEAALKAAYDKFSIKYNEGDVDLNLIKNAYPSTNIK